MKNNKNTLFLILVFIIATLSMAGCGPILPSNTQVGDCTLKVAFINALTEGGPGTFLGITDDVRDKVEITVTLQNIVTEKRYVITLSKDNSYMYTAKLFPGTYRVVSVDSTMNEYTGMHIKANAEAIELGRDVPKNLGIGIDNEEEFESFQSNLVASEEIISMPRFSRKLLIGGNMVDIQDAMSALNLTSEEIIKPYAKYELGDENLGIELTLLNDSSSSRAVSECKIIAIHITKSTAMIPGGITLGMQAETVCNKATGIYGEPTGFEGIAMYGQGLGDVKALYLDNESGDKISLDINTGDGYISGITYELEVYE